jgi:hypothetical protein
MVAGNRQSVHAKEVWYGHIVPAKAYRGRHFHFFGRNQHGESTGIKFSSWYILRDAREMSNRTMSQEWKNDLVLAAPDVVSTLVRVAIG